MELGIQIDEPFRQYIKQGWLEQVIQKTLAMEGVSSKIELGLVITNDETVRGLNREYRGADMPTDVLAFALAEGYGNHVPFITPPDGLVHLGEVILSYPRAVKQAEEYGHSVEQEVALLVIHGVLHLLGYEDEVPEREMEMKALEGEILGKIKFG
jgi:probable rRNA maturation factor